MSPTRSVGKILTAVEVAAINNVSEIERNLDSPERVVTAMKRGSWSSIRTLSVAVWLSCPITIPSKDIGLNLMSCVERMVRWRRFRLVLPRTTI